MASRVSCYFGSESVYFFVKYQGSTAAVQGTAFLVVLLLVGGCSPAEKATADRSGNALADSGGGVNAGALERMIDGSVFQAQGEHARAILEFQDALRYQSDPAIYAALARSYAALGKNSLAIDAAREAVRLAPNNLTYRRVLAEASVLAFDINGAIAEFQEIIRRDSSDLGAWYGLARMYEPQKPLKAIEVYESLLHRTGPQWGALVELSELYARVNQNDKAIGALHQLLDLDPGNEAVTKMLAQSYVRAGALDSALAIYRDLVERDPTNPEYRSEMAGVLLFMKDYEGAAREFRVLLASDSVSVETKVRIGELYFGQLEKDSTLAPVARSLFEQIRDEHPDDWRPYWFLGAIAGMERDDSAAERNFSTVSRLAPWNADSWVFLSMVYMRAEDFARAAVVLEEGLKSSPDNFRVNFFLGVAYSRVGRNPDAVRVLEQARRINPNDIDALTQLALVYDNLKMFTESDSLYEEGLRREPTKPVILNNYAYSLADRGLQLDRALEMATQALKADPENASYLDTMGWIEFRLGNYSEAERYIRKAVERGEASAVVYEHLGDVYSKLQDNQRAIEYWNKAYTKDPKNAALKEKISRGTL